MENEILCFILITVIRRNDNCSVVIDSALFQKADIGTENQKITAGSIRL